MWTHTSQKKTHQWPITRDKAPHPWSSELHCAPCPPSGEHCKHRPPAYGVGEDREPREHPGSLLMGVHATSTPSIPGGPQHWTQPPLSIYPRETQTRTIEHTNLVCTNRTSTSRSPQQHVAVHAHTGPYSAVTRTAQRKPRHQRLWTDLTVCVLSEWSRAKGIHYTVFTQAEKCKPTYEGKPIGACRGVWMREMD